MPFLLHIQVPCDTGFTDPVRELVDRLAQYAGYQPSDARQIGDSAAGAFARMQGCAAHAELAFQTSDVAFELTLVLAGAMAETPAGFTCIREGERTICRLQRNLPEAFSN